MCDVSAQELLTDKDLSVYIGLHTGTYDGHRLSDEQLAWVLQAAREPTFMREDDEECVHLYTHKTQVEFMQSVVIYSDDNYVSPRSAHSWWNLP